MFGDFHLINKNTLVEKVDFQIQNDARYKTTNSSQVIIIDTPLARVYINQDTYFTNIPESVWDAHFEGELSPKQFLEEKIGKVIDDQDINGFKKLLSDLIDAEFNAKNQNQ